MNSPLENDLEIHMALKDLGMEPKMIEQFISSFHSGRGAKAKQILSSHRAKLLSDVHSKQNILYCMDILIRKLNSTKKL